MIAAVGRLVAAERVAVASFGYIDLDLRSFYFKFKKF
jgi:hypothetical protein